MHKIMNNQENSGTTPNESNPVGRPKAEADEQIISGLAGIGCTVEEIATVTGVSKRTLERNFDAAIKEGRENARVSLRRMQWKSAEKGNPALLIWLGKQLLNQRDKQELVGPGGGPIQHEHFDLTKLSSEQLSELESLVESATPSA